MTVGEAEVRLINLIEARRLRSTVLQEEAESKGDHVPPPPPEACQWTEDHVRAYFKSRGTRVPAATGVRAASATAAIPRLPPPAGDEFARWFPGLALSKTSCNAPRMRVLCFSNAGSAEDVYTSEGTGQRRAPSPLLEWCRASAAECLAVQLPGRNMRLREPPLPTCQAAAVALLPVVASRLYDVPYVVIAHSVGTWVAYEFLQACGARAAWERHCCRAGAARRLPLPAQALVWELALASGLPPPRAAFLSAMAAPDIPYQERPWRPQRGLGEEEFKAECRGWDINEVVFSAAMWPTYQPLMRADFMLFDEYEHGNTNASAAPPFNFPITAFWGSYDQRISKHMVAGWSRFTTGPFELRQIEGNHLWPLEREAKAVWLEAIVERLRALA